MIADSKGSAIRLADLVGALSLVSDLGIGQPMGFAFRGASVAVRLGDALRLTERELSDVYYVALLRGIGCNADAADVSAVFGDELAAKRRSLASLNSHRQSEKLAFVLHSVGAGLPPLRRARLLASVLLGGEKMVKEALTANCEVAERLAGRLGLRPEVQRALGLMFERWDGKGSPGRVKGAEIPVPVRVVQLVRDALVFYDLYGVDAALSMTRERRGRAYDPEVVDRFCEGAPDLLDAVRTEPALEEVLAAEPGEAQWLSQSDLDTALEAVAYFVDLKTPHFRGHSTGVAELAADAARRCGLPETGVTAVRRAGHVHDLGRTGVSNAILDKPGPLTEREWEQVRLHPYYTERALARSPVLAPLGNLAALHHERLDGSGYHRQVSAPHLSTGARILAAADAYHAKTEPRPYRPALSSTEAAEYLRSEVRAGRLDAQAADAVLEAAGHRVRRTRRQWPGGLSEREVEVVRLIARGLTNRQMAASLYVTESTVHHHIQHIYDKIGVSTRAATTLFAMQHGLLTDLGDAE